MVEGITTIELTDVNTGEVEKIESKNMVTNAVRDMLKNPMYLSSERTINFMPFYANFFGGLVCFNSTIQENENNFLAPYSADTIAAGRINFVNTTDDLIRGSFNKNESEFNEEEGYAKYVYDFTTQQGNGIIRSICLTHPDSAKCIGTGTFVEDKIKNKYIKDFTDNHTELSFFIANPAGSRRYTNPTSYGDYKYFNYELPIRTKNSELLITNLFNIDLNNDKANFLEVWGEDIKDHDAVIDHKWHFNLYDSFFCLKYASSIMTSGENKKYKKNKEIIISRNTMLDLIPNALKDDFHDEIKNQLNSYLLSDSWYHKVMFFYDNNKIHLLLSHRDSKYIKKNDNQRKFLLLHYTINLSNNQFAFENYKISDQAFPGECDGETHRYVYKKHNNNKYYFTWENSIYELDMDTLNFEILYTKQGIFCIGSRDNYLICLIENGTERESFDQSPHYSNTKPYTRIVYFDYINKTIKNTLFYMPRVRHAYFDEMPDPFILIISDHYCSRQGSYSSDYIPFTNAELAIRKDYLATINNLPEPIEKTQDKTMKITYTLREV